MQSRTRKIIIVLFAVAALGAVVCDVYLSLNPDYYFFYKPQDRANWLYDPGSVSLVCCVMLVESLVAFLAFTARRPRALWVRCFIGLLVLGPWSFFSTMFVVHMPGYFLFHHLWVWLLVAVLAVGLIGSIVWQMFLRLRKGPPNSSVKRTRVPRAAYFKR